MSEREYIRSATIDIITNQVQDHLDENTMNMYQKMLDQGMSEERAIQLLAFYMEMYIKENFHSQEFNSEKWKAFLDNLEPFYHVPGEYEFDAQEERRNLRHIQREYGKLKSDVEELEDELFVIESHLLVLHALYKIDTFEAKKIIHIVMNRLLDLKNHYTSDYTDYTTEDILSLADGLEKMCNPYINPQLYDYLSKFVDLKDESQFDYIFKNIFLCLSRILVSMDRFEKDLGKNGYFRFISQYIDLEACIDDGPAFIFNENTLKK